MVLLKISAVVVVAIAMALALAHALELPGKMRLQKEQYLAVQAIYYPGFTIGGAAEPVSVLLTALLAFLTPSGSLSFWLTLGACCALALMQVVYWAFIHPVNNFWVRDVNLQGAGAAFFRFGSSGSTRSGQADWTYLRDRWEYSHVARAALAVIALGLLVTALID
ncbi:DUF1772 domain-containing protein [Bradyrhizobium sp. CCBAU 051011]|jgi:hypothetical protein|uniref:anthrone oxygenase family protein n=1 Tax=Bradyrhizobium sp. CCBAU 051011 TaxID=858422 RepID=UPI0013738DF9|nr:anthrone oxygenase family protein [Bradyrhizobium sp. CCBAU 051011]QHO73580.1 DUF1772 domain-containing protein [Bradyrhizobium sp. CCBAU 051011]